MIISTKVQKSFGRIKQLPFSVYHNLERHSTECNNLKCGNPERSKFLVSNPHIGSTYTKIPSIKNP